MNKEQLLKLREANLSKTRQYTMEDLASTEAILPLPVGFYECKITSMPNDPKLTSFRLTVEVEETDKKKKKYGVFINFGKTAESFQMARNNLDYLFQQLNLTEEQLWIIEINEKTKKETKRLNIATLQAQVGKEILVLAIERVTDAGTFVNYSFNTDIMIPYL